MGFRCSLFGHAYGEPEVEREREERGSEVVTVEREVELCDRCGDRNVLTENTEITTAESAAAEASSGEEARTEPTGADESAPTTDPDETAASKSAEGVKEAADAPGGPEGDEGVEVLSEDAPTESTTETSESSSEDGSDATSEDAQPTDREPEDDAELITDAEPGEGDAATEQSPGETVPEDESEADSGPSPGDDEGPPDDDGVIMDESGGERDTGEWPQSETSGQEPSGEPSEWPGADAETTEPQEGNESAGGAEDRTDASAEGEDPAGDRSTPPEPDPGFTSAGPAPSPSEEGHTTGTGEFYCPECGYAVPRHRNSLRVGDICPECHSGYITER